MKKALIILLLTLSLLLSSCAPNSNGGIKVKLDPKNPVSVTVWHYYNGKQQDSFNELVSEFNETVGRTDGIIVESRGFGNVTDLRDSVLASVEQRVGAFDKPNIFAAYPDTAFELDRMGQVVDIAPYLSADEYGSYVESYMEEGSLSNDGVLKVFPIAKSVEVFMLNKTDWDSFANATGATTDDFSTVEELTAIAKKYYEWTDSLTPEPNDGKAFFGRDAFANFVFIGAKQLSDGLVTVDGDNVTLNFDRDIIRRIWDNHYVPYVMGYFSSSGRFRSDDMKIGNIIACIGSSSGASFYPDRVILSDDATYPIELQAFPCPQFEGAQPYAVQQGAGMVVTTADDAAVYASVQFLKWLTQADRNIKFSLDSGYLPVTTEANNMERILRNVDNSTSTLPIIEVAVATVNDNTLYTPPAFETGTAVRDALQYSTPDLPAMPDLAVADRATVVERLEQGMSLEEATADFLSDAYFDAWYNDTLALLEALMP